MKTEPPDIIITPLEITDTSVRNAYNAWRSQRPRLELLHRYYIGDHDFAEIHDDGNKIVANYCAYIAKALRGYMVGNPPKYVAGEDDPAGQEIVQLMRKQNKAAVDSQLALDLSIYGVALELVYLPEGKSEPTSVRVDPRNAFVAYAGDMERDSVFGAVIYDFKDQSDVTHYRMYMYTRTEAMTWESVSTDGGWHIVEAPKPHGFGRVPLIEYRNNTDMLGDFEGILDLQDAANALLSDRQDDKDSFASAMLMIQGALIGTTADEMEEGKEFLKKHKILQLDEDSTAGYLTKTMDETSIQVLQDQYSADIHKFAMVPDLSDEQFSGNASGVAMAYKLFGTDQMMAEKIYRFKDGYRRRVKLYDFRMHNPSMAEGYEPACDMERMDILFQPNTPEDLSYMATALSQLTTAQIMSKRTARMQLSSIPDPDEEAELIAQETAETAQAQSSAFEDPYGGAKAPTEDDDGDEAD